jgi:hypothetical protein
MVEVRVATDTNSASSTRDLDLGNGTFRVSFSGIPGFSYRVEASATVTPPAWQVLGTATADATGAIIFLDTTAGGVSRIYRITIPDPP